VARKQATSPGRWSAGVIASQGHYAAPFRPRRQNGAQDDRRACFGDRRERRLRPNRPQIEPQPMVSVIVPSPSSTPSNSPPAD
jgi:hypothetical protein